MRSRAVALQALFRARLEDVERVDGLGDAGKSLAGRDVKLAALVGELEEALLVLIETGRTRQRVLDDAKGHDAGKVKRGLLANGVRVGVGALGDESAGLAVVAGVVADGDVLVGLTLDSAVARGSHGGRGSKAKSEDGGEELHLDGLVKGVEVFEKLLETSVVVVEVYTQASVPDPHI
jgi:hypothetical protein